MAYPPRSCSKHACILVSPSQTLLIMSAVVVLACFMFSVAVAAAEPPSGGYRFGLTHVDAHGNFTKDELIHRAAERSRLRGRGAAATSAALLGDHEPSHGASSTPMRSKVHFREDEYLMDVEIHDDTYEAIVDTGSSVIWMKPKKPTSRVSKDCDRLPCDDERCPSSQCTSKCEYAEKYGDGLLSSGPMCRETLRLLRLRSGHQPPEYISVDRVAMGWSETKDCAVGKECHDLKKYDGTVGLGRGKGSLVEQLKVHNFSYCLTTYDNTNLRSQLLLGSPDALKESCNHPEDGRCKVHNTRLLRNEDHPSRYYVHLEYIEIGGKRIAPADLPVDQAEEEHAASGGSKAEESTTPNMFIDSGSSFTYLEKKTHDALLEYVGERVKEVTQAKAKEVGETICWNDATHLPGIPDLELHFAGGAVMYLHKDKIMELDKDQQLCLNIRARALDEGHVLGNFQQQNIHMHFDVAKNNLSFVKVDDCTKVV